MFRNFFKIGTHGPDGRYGLVIDIGSSSVGAALVASEPHTTQPMMIWSTRERVALREEVDLATSAKDITTAVMNVFLAAGTTGGKLLREYDSGGKITHIEVAIAAPWSYTLSKRVSYEAETPFKITNTLLDELTTTANAEIKELMETNQLLQKLGLTVIAEDTMSVIANGYLTEAPLDHMTSKIAITQMNGVAESQLIEVLMEAQQKVLPAATMNVNTFMYQFYKALQKLHPHTSETCLVDMTAEATELGIIRDGQLQYVTHIPFGAHSIARDISGLCGVPKEEALGFIRNNSTNLAGSLSTAKQAELRSIVDSYEERLSDLFSRTGDALSIPKTLFAHADVNTEQFFRDRLLSAAAAAHLSDRVVHPITAKLFPDFTSDDTAILLSAYVFHNRLTHQD